MTSKESNDYRLQKQAALISVFVGLGMLVIKFSAYFVTNSAAILSDALESVVHIAATSMALFSIILSRLPADDSHPYGHGKVEFFSVGIEGGLIILAAFAIIYEAVRGLIFGVELASLGIGIFLIMIASIVNLGLGSFLIKQGKATKSITLVADGKHILTDSWTSFGVIAGLGLVKLTELNFLDPVVAIGVALNIIVTGYRLIRQSVAGLMDEADDETLERVSGIVNAERTPSWINLHHLRILRSGHVHHIDFHLTIPFYWNLDRAHKFQHDISDVISTKLDNHATVLIHLDPCKPDCCVFCNEEPCVERESPFDREPGWDVPSLIGDPPYPVGD